MQNGLPACKNKTSVQSSCVGTSHSPKYSRTYNIIRRHLSLHIFALSAEEHSFSSTAPRLAHISSILLYPLNPSVTSVSARSDRSTSSTPCSPPTVSPYTNGRPTAIDINGEDATKQRKKHVRTQDALRAHRDRFNHIASLTDPRVEQNRELSFTLRAEHSRRRSDLLQRRERRNRAVNLPSTCRSQLMF